MNWDAIGAVGEIVGAGAVVVSLLYLALQVKAQNRESRIASTHDIYEAFRNVTAPYQDAEVTALVVKSVDQGFGNLSEPERLHLIFLVVPFLRVWEESFYQRQNGRLEDAIWASIDAQYRDAMGVETNQKIWEIRRHVFSDEFRDYVDSVNVGEYRTK